MDFLTKTAEKYQKKHYSFFQFIKFGVVGTIGAGVDFGIYILITRILDFWTVVYIFDYKIIAANIISVACAIVSNFFWNKYWTFKDLRKNVFLKQIAQFFILSAITYVLNQILVSYFVFYTSLENIFGTKEDLVAKLITILIIMFLNFTISKFIVFKKK